MKLDKKGTFFLCKIKKIFIVFIISLIPIIFPVLLTSIIGDGVSIRTLCASGGDSAFWWMQIDALVNYGGIHGYYGFNGSVAPFGGFYNWGAAPLFPYFVFGKLFGWKLYSMTLANVAMLSVAMFAFLTLTNATKANIVKVVAFYMCSFYTVGYSMYATSEGERYALGMILVGIVLYVHKNESIFSGTNGRKRIIWQEVGIFIAVIFSSTVFLPFLIVLPLLMYDYFKRCKWNIIIKVCFIISICAVCTLIAMTGLHFTSAPFGVAEATDNMGLWILIKSMINGLVNNLEVVNLFNVIHYDSKPMFWFFIVYIVMVAVTVYNFLRVPKYSTFLPMYYIVGFLVGICLLDTGEPNSVARLINTGLIMGLLSECILKDKEANGDTRTLGTMIVFVIVSTLAISGAWKMYKNALVEGGHTYEIRENLVAERNKFDELTDISKSKDRYDNTVAYYGVIDRMCLSVPGGSGINYMYNMQVDSRMKYAVIRTENLDYSDLLANLEADYDIVFQDEYFVMMERQ